MAAFQCRERVKRITCGHGDSTLGVEVYLNFWGKKDIPDLKEGDEVIVTIRRPDDSL